MAAPMLRLLALGIPFGPRFGTGDTVGCGVIYETGEVRLVVPSEGR
jgi:hypothetical protein